MSIDFYNTNAEDFFNDTITVDLSNIYQEFLPLLPLNAHILDAGCGSGRDAKHFIEQGFHVTAFDASDQLARKASDYLRIEVFTTTFDQFTSNRQFDAIWACASLLHVNSAELPQAFNNLAKHLKTGGIFYCSFKYGENDVHRNGRYFTNANEQRLAHFINNSTLNIQRTWLTHDARPDRQNEKWLNAILVKR